MKREVDETHQIRFQIYVLLERHDRAHVVAALDWLEGLLGGPEAFRRVFGLILTDRGCEFDDIAGIERDGRCRVFYADPQRSDQKGACEKNHVELRKVIPKDTTIDGLGLDAWILAGVCSNVNSSLRSHRRRLADGPREGGAAGLAPRGPRPRARPAG